MNTDNLQFPKTLKDKVHQVLRRWPENELQPRDVHNEIKEVFGDSHALGGIRSALSTLTAEGLIHKAEDGWFACNRHFCDGTVPAQA